jgi:hypothetical protein
MSHSSSDMIVRGHPRSPPRSFETCLRWFPEGGFYKIAIIVMEFVIRMKVGVMAEVCGESSF